MMSATKEAKPGGGVFSRALEGIKRAERDAVLAKKLNSLALARDWLGLKKASAGLEENASTLLSGKRCYVALGELARSGDRGLSEEAESRFAQVRIEDVEKVPAGLHIGEELVRHVATYDGHWGALGEIARYAPEEAGLRAVDIAAARQEWNSVIYAGCYAPEAVARHAVDVAREAGREDVVRIIAAQLVTASAVVGYARGK